MLMRRVGYALLLSAFALMSLPALADSSVRIVRLSYIDGDVQVDRGAGAGFERAILNLPVTQGMQLETGDGATVEIEFEDGSTLRLIPNTSVAFTQLILRDDGRRQSSIELRSGTAYLETSNKKDDFTIVSGGRQVTIARPARLRLERGDADLRVAVFKGDVDVRGEGDPVRVKKDETVTLDLSDASRYQLAKGIDEQSYDSWSLDRDKYREAYASEHHDNYNASYNSSYNYGWSDLNYYGNFISVASYGPVWRPYGFGPGWDPFADGAWVWYPGYGYTWVSAYPWGWAPYRYGSWIFVPGYGWCWRPARRWNTWTGVPVIVGPPRGYIAPRPPVIAATVAGPVPRTIVVGHGPVHDVRDPRFERWMLDRQQNAPAARNIQVTPVPPKPTVTTTTTGAPGQKAGISTTTTGAPKSSPSNNQGNAGRNSDRHVDDRVVNSGNPNAGSTKPVPPQQPVTPPPPPPPRQATTPPPPRPVSPPPPVPSGSSSSSTQSSGGRTSGSSSGSHHSSSSGSQSSGSSSSSSPNPK